MNGAQFVNIARQALGTFARHQIDQDPQSAPMGLFGKRSSAFKGKHVLVTGGTGASAMMQRTIEAHILHP